jgi:hypothetical protein
MKTTTTTPANLPPRGASCRVMGMVARLAGEDGCCGEYLTLDISVCLAGFAGMLARVTGGLGVGKGAPVLVLSVETALGYWKKEGVHLPLGYVAKINPP